uniref:Uncharacterized protein n=1 Tax=Anguilla anguilla TaxID=7936 RepID=A0A0E9PAM9_ANGAN
MGNSFFLVLSWPRQKFQLFQHRPKYKNYQIQR